MSSPFADSGVVPLDDPHAEGAVSTCPPSSAPATADGSQEEGPNASGLPRNILADLVPGLLLLHRPSAQAGGLASANDGLVREFCEQLLNATYAQVNAFLDHLVGSGMPGIDVLENVLGPAARALGEAWEEDEVSFTDVTLAACTLHRLLRERDWGGERIPPVNDAADKSICIITLAGDDHMLGALIVTEVFRLHGWRVSPMIGTSHEDVISKIAAEHWDVLGVSLSISHKVSDVARIIADFRAASHNPDLKVIVGGPGFDQDTDIVALTGADAFLADAQSAPVVAAALRGEPGIRR